MTKPALELSQFHLKNFKAVRDSKPVYFTPLTVFIGNNGVGKSSLVEGLETFRDVVLEGVDPAFRRWRGFELLALQGGEDKRVDGVRDLIRVLRQNRNDGLDDGRAEPPAD